MIMQIREQRESQKTSRERRFTETALDPEVTETCDKDSGSVRPQIKSKHTVETILKLDRIQENRQNVAKQNQN